jgi:hypothetical protein
MAVTVGVTTQTKGTEQASAASVSSRRVLAEPTDVSVGAPVLGTEKAGQDLVVRLANGETQTIENFFVIGPDGDFSRLLSASGTPVVTGLMAPEPDMPQDSEFTQGMQAPQGVAAADTASAEDDGTGTAGDWDNTALFAGAGFSLGSGIGLLSGDDSDAAPARTAQSTQPETEADLVEVIDALTGPEDAALQPSDFELHPSEEEAPSSEFGDENATKLTETYGFLESDSPDPGSLYIPDPQDELLADLMTEITG